LSNCSSKGAGALHSYGCAAGDLVARVKSSLACTVQGSVSVRSFRGYSMVNNVLESLIHIASVASFVFVVTASAVNKLLFREGGE
jgi:hypothetical protein